MAESACLQCMSWPFDWRNSPLHPFLPSNRHFWQMTQMSEKCLLCKTEKTQISEQTQIIWVDSSPWSILYHPLIVVVHIASLIWLLLPILYHHSFTQVWPKRFLQSQLDRRRCRIPGPNLASGMRSMRVNTNLISYKSKVDFIQIQVWFHTNTNLISYKYKSNFIEIKSWFHTNTSLIYTNTNLISYRYKSYFIQIKSWLHTNKSLISNKYKSDLI